MNEPTFQKIAAELEAELIGQKFGKIFPLSRYRFTFDFRLSDSKYLFISIEPTSPRIYIIKRRFKDLDKLAKNPTSFVNFLRTRLSHGVLEKLEKFADERILKFSFLTRNDVGQNEIYFLIAQLTGRSANLFLLDKNEYILDSCRENSGAGQEIANKFSPPFREEEKRKSGEREIFSQKNFESLSEALDNFYLEKETEISFQNKAKSARGKLKKEIDKRKKLVKNLKSDLENHGDAETWKRFGDLLLANLAMAKREGNKIFVTDYYDEDTPTVEIEIDENDAINEAAEKFFKRYTKSRNAKEEVSKRLKIVEAELEELNFQKEKLETAIEEKDENFLSNITDKTTQKTQSKTNDKKIDNFSGAREFTSSDGFEILVGRRAKDNDFLTFRVAKSLDLWLHAADYPGSHVVVKNPNRQEIPLRTLLEAAQIAAFYSQAKSQGKVAVHYTQKKFVNKPKGAVPGLVSLASFKTILVEPKIFEDSKQ
jgi:predicted ribosome quality control (RQC) complex YloA/Tae2 family protein